MVVKTEYYILIENTQNWALSQQDDHGLGSVTSSLPEEHCGLNKSHKFKWRTGAQKQDLLSSPKAEPSLLFRKALGGQSIANVPCRGVCVCVFLSLSLS